MANGETGATACDHYHRFEGLSETLKMLKDDYVGTLPIFITENGMAWDDTVQNGAVDDLARARYLFDHLAQGHAARANGANVQGYFYWSLLDNFEWAFGYEKCFGMVHVNLETLQRVPKNSF